MIKDTFFSPTRFLNLCRKDMVENWKTNLIRIAMLFGIMLLLFVGRGYFAYQHSGSHIDPMVDFSLHTLLFFLFTFGILMASVTMDKMKTKTSRLSVLMTPVTPFENFFSRWFTYTVVYLVILIIAFLLADYARVIICRLIYPDATIVPASLKYIFASSGSYKLFAGQMFMLQTFLQYFLFQSFFVLGSSIWSKNSFIKTLTAGIIMVFSYSLVMMLTIYIGWGQLNIRISNMEVLDINLELMNRVSMLIIVFFTLFNWVMAYFRFKESDVIQ